MKTTWCMIMNYRDHLNTKIVSFTVEHPYENFKILTSFWEDKGCFDWKLSLTRLLRLITVRLLNGPRKFPFQPAQEIRLEFFPAVGIFYWSQLISMHQQHCHLVIKFVVDFVNTQSGTTAQCGSKHWTEEEKYIFQKKLQWSACVHD